VKKIPIQQTNTIGQRFRALRLLLPQTLFQFGETLRLHPGRLQDIEDGKARPCLSTLTQLHRDYGLNLQWLLLGIGNIFNIKGPKLPLDKNLPVTFLHRACS